MSGRKSRFKYPQFNETERAKVLEFLDVARDYAASMVDELKPFADRDPSDKTMGELWYYTSMIRVLKYLRPIAQQSGKKRGKRSGKKK